MWPCSAFLHRASNADFVPHLSQEVDGSQPVQTGEMITVTDDSFNVNATCEYCTETELKLVQNLSIVIKGRSSITANFHIEKKKKKKLSHFPLFLSLSCCTNSSYLQTSLSYHTSPSFTPPLFLSLAVSIYLPIPLGVFPPPYNQCGF